MHAATEQTVTAPRDGARPVTATGGAANCYHCGLPVAAGLDLGLRIDGAERAMCCHGCKAVAAAIIAAGHENFYRLRTEASPSGQQLLPDFMREAEVYDLPEIQQQFVHASGEARREASLILEGITCAACVWLNEQYLAALPGVEQVRVNYATQRALVRWDDRRIKLSEILQAVHRIGYRALPFNPDRQQRLQRRERRAQQRRLAVAGLFGMQVMMLSISLYAGAFSGMEAAFEQFFRWLNLLLTLPVLLYSARPFFNAAWRDLRRARVAMDLPVSLAIGIAFASSALATLRGDGEIYFDSVVMFVFFLSASRYFETMARQRCAASVEALAQSLPLMTTRIDADGGSEKLAAAKLAIGDRVLLRPGDTVPADGVVENGSSAVDESLLSGESRPLVKQPGELILGGSVNVTEPMQMRVSAVGADTVLAEIQRTMERAQAARPPRARLAERVAARFIAVVLVIVCAVAGYWWITAPERWFEIALAVLIVSCPCALSLATPTAISAALVKLQSAGLLVKQGAALEKLGQITHVVFDKTGTLTEGKPQLQRVISADDRERERCLQLAAALDSHSAHPLAQALVEAAGKARPVSVENLSSVAGGGISGRIDGCDYFLGSPEFVLRQTGNEPPAHWLDAADEDESLVLLARADRVLALFGFIDAMRAESAVLIRRLQRMRMSVILMSGDRAEAARKVAAATGIGDYRASMSPAEKMQAVAALQAGGACVLMVGDGINDAPVLARADVSIAMGSASALARTGADIVLIADRLGAVATAIVSARRTRRVILQNMSWALLYNFGAIPAAAAGLVAPWLAAAGMSLSSLVVVLNASRLLR